MELSGGARAILLRVDDVGLLRKAQRQRAEKQPGAALVHALDASGRGRVHDQTGVAVELDHVLVVETRLPDQVDQGLVLDPHRSVAFDLLVLLQTVHVLVERDREEQLPAKDFILGDTVEFVGR